MSISYEQQDTMLYDIEWEVSLDRIKCSSTMFNKALLPWIISWKQENIVQFLIILNDRATLGKVCLKPNTKKIVYEIAANLTPCTMSENIRLIANALYKSASKFVMEISNSVFLYHSNPSLRAKDIVQLAPKYGKQDLVTIDEKSEYNSIAKCVKTDLVSNIPFNRIILHRKIKIEDYQEIYEGKYLNLPCFIIFVEDLNFLK